MFRVTDMQLCVVYSINSLTVFYHYSHSHCAFKPHKRYLKTVEKENDNRGVKLKPKANKQTQTFTLPGSYCVSMLCTLTFSILALAQI